MREAEGHSWGAGLGDLLLPRGLDDAGEVLVELARADRGYQVVEQLVELATFASATAALPGASSSGRPAR